MAELGDAVGSITPSFSFSGLGTAFSFFAFAVLVLIIAAVVSFFIMKRGRYNKKVTFLENIAGRGYVPTTKDKAIIIKMGDSGEEIMVTRKSKQLLHAYGKKIGKNHYAFAKGSDGYWYNVVFGDLDVALGEIGLTPIDKEVRYANKGVRDIVKERFQKKNWFKDNIGLVVGITSIVIVLIFLWLIFREFSAITSGAAQAVEASKEVMDSAAQVLRGLDNIKSGGSGLVPA